jgi:hypothetical protein
LGPRTLPLAGAVRLVAVVPAFATHEHRARTKAGTVRPVLPGGGGRLAAHEQNAAQIMCRTTLESELFAPMRRLA